MLNDNGRFAVGRHAGCIRRILGFNGLLQIGCLVKGFLPTVVAQLLEIFIGNVGRHDAVDYQFAEMVQLRGCWTHSGAESVEGTSHKKRPTEIKTVLFGHRPVLSNIIEEKKVASVSQRHNKTPGRVYITKPNTNLVVSGDLGSFYNKLCIWNSAMIDVMNQCAARQKRKRIRSDVCAKDSQRGDGRLPRCL